MTAHPLSELCVVTGAFGYLGRYIARLLLAEGKRVLNLTGHPRRPDPFDGQVAVASLDFSDPEGLTRSLQGAVTLYNTYWVRFPRGRMTFDRAVENSRTLITAAADAGVRRLVHVSITNASSESNLPYFRGKGLVEEAIKASKLSYAIIRPTLLFGNEDLLTNNIAWALRRFPLFPIFGAGNYQVQPVYVGDVADLAVAAAAGSDNRVVDAVGPETYTFEELVRLLASSTGSNARLIHVTPRIAHTLIALIGYVVRDVVLTRDEIDGLMAGLLVSAETQPTGKTRLSRWAGLHAGLLGREYRSELRRHYR